MQLHQPLLEVCPSDGYVVHTLWYYSNIIRASQCLKSSTSRLSVKISVTISLHFPQNINTTRNYCSFVTRIHRQQVDSCHKESPHAMMSLCFAIHRKIILASCLLVYCITCIQLSRREFVILQTFLALTMRKNPYRNWWVVNNDWLNPLDHLSSTNDRFRLQWIFLYRHSVILGITEASLAGVLGRKDHTKIVPI